MKSYSPIHLFCAFAVCASVSSLHAQVSLINDSFSSGSITTHGGDPINRLQRDDAGWNAGPDATGWTINTTDGRMENTSNVGNNVSDGAAAQIVDLSGLGLTGENQLKVDFTYSSWNGTANSDDIYVHVWGLVDGGSTSATSLIANLGAQSGAMWADAVDNGFTVYNLGTGSQLAASGEGIQGNAAIQLLDQDTGDASLSNAIAYSSMFDMSGYSLDTLAQYDYFVIGFARSPDAGIGNSLALHNVTVSAVPEPGTYALVAGLLSLAAVMLRRRS